MSKFVVGDFVRLKRDRSVTLKVIHVYPPASPDGGTSYGCRSVFSLVAGHAPHDDFVGSLQILKEYQLTMGYIFTKVTSPYNVTK